MRPIYEVYVCVYQMEQSAWHIRIGCSAFDRRRELNNLLRIARFTVVDSVKITVHHCTNFFIELNGMHRFVNYKELRPIK